MRLKPDRNYFFLALWLLCIAIGLKASLDYEKTPGLANRDLRSWPGSSSLKPIGELTLVCFLHPKCPCSLASIRQLKKLLSLNPELRGYLCFKIPEKFDDSFVYGRNWQEASQLLSMKTVCDRKEAACFRAETSGETFLFASDGKLLFHGGITAGRGHDGDNHGFDRLKTICCGRIPPAMYHGDSDTKNGNQNESENQSYAVYGCALNDHPLR